MASSIEVGARAQHDDATARFQPGDGLADSCAGGSGRDHHRSTAESLQFDTRVRSGAVDVVVGAELRCERSFVGSAADGCDLEAHVPCVLHGEVPEAADPEDGDEFARLRRRSSERAERRDPGTQQRRRCDRSERVGNRHECALFGEHDIGISAVELHSGERLVSTTH